MPKCPKTITIALGDDDGGGGGGGGEGDWDFGERIQLLLLVLLLLLALLPVVVIVEDSCGRIHTLGQEVLRSEGNRTDDDVMMVCFWDQTQMQGRGRLWRQGKKRQSGDGQIRILSSLLVKVGI